MSGGGGSKTQVVQPKLDPGVQQLWGGGGSGSLGSGIYKLAYDQYSGGAQKSNLPNLGERAYVNQGMKNANLIQGLGYKTQNAASQMMSLANKGLGNYGGWQQALSKAASGKVNPQIHGMVDSAQNAAMRQFDRVKQGYTNAYERMASQADRGFKSAALTTEQTYESMARTSGQELDRAIMNAGQQYEQSARNVGQQFDQSVMSAGQEYDRMAGLATKQTEDARLSAMSDYETARLGAISGYERAAVPIKADLEQYFSDQDQSFYEGMLPSIRGQASQVGGYGGSRHQMSDAIAARDVQQSKLQQLGRVGEAFGLGAGQMGEQLALNAGQLGRSNLANATRLGDQLGMGAAQMGAGFGMGAAQMGQGFGAGAANLGQGFGMATAQHGANLAAGAADTGRQLALGATQMGQALAEGASQAGDNIYQAGMQQAEAAADIGRQMYGDAFESAQNRALQAASIGANVSAQERQMQANLMNSAMGGYGQAAGLFNAPMSIYAGVGQMQDQINNKAYNNQWQNLQNYVGAVSPGSWGPGGGGMIPGQGSQMGSAIGTGLAGAGTGFLVGGPWGAAAGGGLGLLGGLM